MPCAFKSSVVLHSLSKTSLSISAIPTDMQELEGYFVIGLCRDRVSITVGCESTQSTSTYQLCMLWDKHNSRTTVMILTK